MSKQVWRKPPSTSRAFLSNANNLFIIACFPCINMFSFVFKHISKTTYAMTNFMKMFLWHLLSSTCLQFVKLECKHSVKTGSLVQRRGVRHPLDPCTNHTHHETVSTACRSNRWPGSHMEASHPAHPACPDCDCKEQRLLSFRSHCAFGFLCSLCLPFIPAHTQSETEETTNIYWISEGKHK